MNATERTTRATTSGGIPPGMANPPRPAGQPALTNHAPPGKEPAPMGKELGEAAALDSPSDAARDGMQNAAPEASTLQAPSNATSVVGRPASPRTAPTTSAANSSTMSPLSSVPTADAEAEALSDRVRALRLPPQVISRSSASGRIGWALCVVLAAVVGYLGYRLHFQAGKTSAVTAKAGESTAAPDPSTQVATAAPAAGDLFTLEAKGYIIPARQILVSPQVNGILTKLNVQEGMRVAKDDVLAVLETTDYAAAVRRNEAALKLAEQALLELQRGNRPEEVKQAEADLAESEAQRKYLSDVVARNAELVRTNVMPREEYDEAVSKFEAMDRRVTRLRYALELMRIGPRQERIAMAQADMERARAELDRARWQLDNCTIRAPISGTILKKNAEEGNLVNPIAMNGSFSLCDLADLSDLEVDLSIQERDISQVAKGQKCKIRAEAYPDRVYEGFVSRLMPIADRAKGAIPVRVKVFVPKDEEGVYLKPEMGAIVSFLKDPNGTAAPLRVSAAISAPDAGAAAASPAPSVPTTAPPAPAPDRDARSANR